MIFFPNVAFMKICNKVVLGDLLQACLCGWSEDRRTFTTDSHTRGEIFTVHQRPQPLQNSSENSWE